jgi:hypothetical protein
MTIDELHATKDPKSKASVDSGVLQKVVPQYQGGDSKSFGVVGTKPTVVAPAATEADAAGPAVAAAGATEVPAAKRPKKAGRALKVKHESPLETFNAYAEKSWLRLRKVQIGPGGAHQLCDFTVRQILRVSINWMRYKPSDLAVDGETEVLGLSRLDRLGLRQVARNPTKEGMLDLADRYNVTICCAANCLERVPLAAKLCFQDRILSAVSAGDSVTDVVTACSESFAFMCVPSRQLLLDVSELELQRVDEEITAMALDGAVLERATHGNTGFEPVNSMPETVQGAVRMHIKLFTWFDPGVQTKDGLGLRRPVSDDCEGVSGAARSQCSASHAAGEQLTRCRRLRRTRSRGQDGRPQPHHWPPRRRTPAARCR